MIRLLAVALFVAISSVTYGQSNELKRGDKSITEAQIRSLVTALSADSMQGRYAGSAGAHRAADFLEAQLSQLGYSVTRQHFSDSLQNLLCHYRGADTTVRVIVGAHYDHLGVDSLGNIYNGADDNASGAVAVVEIARAFKAAGITPKYSVVFALWDGEEKGLRGSRYYVKNSVKNSNSVAYYMNFDMIGRNTDESRPMMFRYIYTASAPQFVRWLEEAISLFDLKLEPDLRPSPDMSAGSDNVPFAKRGIKVVWFHTDGHPDYHKPTDTADKINFSKLTDITRASYYILWQMAQ